MTVYEIDGDDFSTLEEFYDEISRVLIPGVYWGRNLDAFNDILRGGFGTPDDGFTLRWKRHEVSRQRLGYARTRAQAKMGETVFEELLEIIRIHGPGGRESEDKVELVLS